MEPPRDPAPPPTVQPTPASSGETPVSARPSPRALHFRRHRRAWLITASVTVFALLAAGAVLGGVATGAGQAGAGVGVGVGEPGAASVVAGPTPTPTPTEPAARPAPEAATTASRLRTCSVAGLAADTRLADFQGQVRNARTGEVLFDRGGNTPGATASVMKVLTSAAALTVLGPDYRATTTVLVGAEPGQVVLVGGGDLTLSRLPSGQQSFYPGAAHLDALASATVAAWNTDPSRAGTPITSLVLDSTLFEGPGWDSGWARSELALGYMPEITALQVDGDRDNPARGTSPRSEDPVARAGLAFSDALSTAGAGAGLVVTRAAAPLGAEPLASVESQPVSTLIQQALIISDNTLAEMLARLVAVQAGAGTTFAALQDGIVGGLAPYGIDTAGLSIADGSGLSPANAVPPAYLTRLFQQIESRAGDLGVIFDALPVAGASTGSLSYSDRFVGDNGVADGAVFAKTGWITTGFTLAGIVHAADGTALTFAVYALGDVDATAKQAIDTITTGFYRCGDNLSNN